MAKVRARADASDLYREDFYVWTRRQAELVRAGRFNDLDLPHLIEEVEDLGASQRKETFSRSEQIIRHLLKLQYAGATESRVGWRGTVRDQRDELELILTPSLRNETRDTLATRYERAPRDLADHGEQVSGVPPRCPYTLEQILDPDWYPDNLHGLKDPQP